MSKFIYLILQQNLIQKKPTATDTSNLALKSNLSKLQAEVDKVDINKLKTVPVDLRKLSNVVDNEVVKKLCMMNQLQG